MFYAMFVEADVLIELDSQVCRDEQVNTMTSSEEIFGLLSEYEYIHPDCVIFFDEVSDNTNMKDDELKGAR